MNIGALVGLDLDVPLWLIFIVANLIAYYLYATWRFSTWKNMGIPGPAPSPVFGNFGAWMKKGIMECELENIKKYGKIHGIYMARTPSLTVADVDTLKQVMVKEFPNFVDRQVENFSPKESLFSAGMFSLLGDHWKHVRNSLSPTFTGEKLKLMQHQIIKCADQLVHHVGKANADNPEGFEFKKLSDCFSMDVIAFTTYGIELDSHANPDNIFVRKNKEILNISLKDPRVILFFFFPFLSAFFNKVLPIVSRESDKFFLKVTDDLLKDRKTGVSKQQKDFIQMMADSVVEDPKESDLSKPNVHKDDIGLVWTSDGLTKKEIAANSVGYLLAGFENISATMSFVVYCLATNPEVQERLQAEIDDKIGETAPRYEDVSEMTYLQQVLDETQRIYTLAPRLERAVKKDITINGIFFKKDTQVGIPVYALHMDPDVWPEPTKFDPERFTEEAKANRDPYYYMPFGMGPRNCIGMRLAMLEMKIAVVRLLQKFTFMKCAKTEEPLKLEKMRIRPENGVFISVKPR